MLKNTEETNKTNREVPDKTVSVLLTHRKPPFKMFFRMESKPVAGKPENDQIAVSFNNTSNIYIAEVHKGTETFERRLENISEVLELINKEFPNIKIAKLYIEANLTEVGGVNITQPAMASFVELSPRSSDTRIFSGTDACLDQWRVLADELINKGLLARENITIGGEEVLPSGKQPITGFDKACLPASFNPEIVKGNINLYNISSSDESKKITDLEISEGLKPITETIVSQTNNSVNDIKTSIQQMRIDNVKKVNEIPSPSPSPK